MATGIQTGLRTRMRSGSVAATTQGRIELLSKTYQLKLYLGALLLLTLSSARFEELGRLVGHAHLVQLPGQVFLIDNLAQGQMSLLQEALSQSSSAAAVLVAPAGSFWLLPALFLLGWGWLFNRLAPLALEDKGKSKPPQHLAVAVLTVWALAATSASFLGRGVATLDTASGPLLLQAGLSAPGSSLFFRLSPTWLEYCGWLLLFLTYAGGLLLLAWWRSGRELPNSARVRDAVLMPLASGLWAFATLTLFGWFWLEPYLLLATGGLVLYLARRWTSLPKFRQPGLVRKTIIARFAPRRVARASDPAVDLSVVFGGDLHYLLEGRPGKDLLERARAVRQHLAGELGVCCDDIVFRKCDQLLGQQYKIELRGIEVARAELRAHQYLVLLPEPKASTLRGERGLEPASGLPGVWVSPEQRGDGERLGGMIFDNISLLANHLTQVIRKHAKALYSLDSLVHSLELLKTQAPFTVKLARQQLALPEIGKVCRLLLKEQVSILDLRTILETMLANPGACEDMAEQCRVALGASTCARLLAREKMAQAIVVETWPPTDAVRRALAECWGDGFSPVLVTRRELRRRLKECFSEVPVLSFAEIPPEFEVVVRERIA